MTAQASESLVFEGQQYLVRDFIGLPGSVERPPEQMLIDSTSMWRGFLCDWEIRLDRGKSRLFLNGFHCLGGYFPLYEPVLNPISAKIKVAPKDSELLKYVHMGYESKLSGERYLVFINGTLTDIEEIPDHMPNSDGLRDLAKIHPLGEEEGLKLVDRFRFADGPSPSTRIGTRCTACGEHFEFDFRLHHMEFIIEDDPEKMQCARCISELTMIARHLENWKVYPPFAYQTPRPSMNVSLHIAEQSIEAANIGSGKKSGPQDYHWLRLHEISDCAEFWYGNRKRNLTFCITGLIELDMPEKFEFKDDPSIPDLDTKLQTMISKDLNQFTDLRFFVSAGYGRINLEKQYVKNIPIAAQHDFHEQNFSWISDAFINLVIDVAGLWEIERKTLKTVAHKSWANAVDTLTSGTGIYPYSPSDLTPIDTNIIRGRRDIVEHRLVITQKNYWAVRPRHSKDGWIPGESVSERYLKSLNL